MYAFEVTMLGGLGGPLEISSQCFLIREYGSSDTKCICIDGGAGVGHICEILRIQNENYSNSEFGTEDYVLDDIHGYYYDNNKNAIDSDKFDVDEGSNKLIPKGFTNVLIVPPRARNSQIDPRKDMIIRYGFSKDLLTTLSDKPTIIQKAFTIYNGIKEYYITHPHLDHIAGMVVNSPLNFDSNIDGKKTILGLPFTTDSLRKYIFNDSIWPNLIDEGNEKSRLKLTTLTERRPVRSPVFPNWEIIPFKINHGLFVNGKGQVFSSVYIVRNIVRESCIILCGDVDFNQTSSCGDGKNLLEEIWKYISENIPFKNVKGLFIECSSSNTLEDGQLYGHLSPRHLIKELELLHDNVERQNNKEPFIFSLNVILTHVKLTYSDIDPRHLVLNEIEKLIGNDGKLKDVNFSVALNKHRYVL